LSSYSNLKSFLYFNPAKIWVLVIYPAPSKQPVVRYEIIFSPEAEADIAALKASDRAKALDAIETFLRYEPEKISKSRIKRLREMQKPQYRLRVDELRAFYDVSYTEDGQGIVEVLRIREKSEVMEWLAEFGRREE
jgi:mRNA-degrading endonuclease RelE of RelBE toxin-antitoxin system